MLVSSFNKITKQIQLLPLTVLKRAYKTVEKHIKELNRIYKPTNNKKKKLIIVLPF